MGSAGRADVQLRTLATNAQVSAGLRGGEMGLALGLEPRRTCAICIECAMCPPVDTGARPSCTHNPVLIRKRAPRSTLTRGCDSMTIDDRYCEQCGTYWGDKDADYSYPGSACDIGECLCQVCETGEHDCAFHRQLELERAAARRGA
jgi:hypothetical protein